MANIQLLVPLILKWEGGYVDDPADLGGATNMGVTLSTWESAGYDKNNDGLIDKSDLLLLNRHDMVEHILRPHYWDRWQADRIISQSLANILVDWVWMSGKRGIIIPQRLLGVTPDGIAGGQTLTALNGHASPKELFGEIKQAREDYINDICIKRPANHRFKKGWLNRLADFQWTGILLMAFAFVGCRTHRMTVSEKMTTQIESTQSQQFHAADSTVVRIDQTESLQLSGTGMIRSVIRKYDTAALNRGLPPLLSEETIITRVIEFTSDKQAALHGETINQSGQSAKKETAITAHFRQEASLQQTKKQPGLGWQCVTILMAGLGLGWMMRRKLKR